MTDKAVIDRFEEDKAVLVLEEKEEKLIVERGQVAAG
jgi:hypothetical protein